MKSLLLSLLLLAGTINKDNDYLAQFQSEAQEKNQNIAVYFSGSDWCSNCHYFKNKILNQEAVKATLDQKYIFYIADFPQRKKLPEAERKTNEALAEKLNPEGVFPLLVIVDKTFTVKTKIYKGNTLEKVVESLKTFETPEP
ncbi:hypothetical protein DBR32_01345 [Taibaiella sp. KBW10]|uniref:thioredoxin fold domain-containing protein n=1 Tax=Taibaiella sp. KBW10 TaxID=2153357 RepID=UPI000F593D42|nr:thioredoxin fold domain-containing protein [Taibaiella sp. KBW10]RQO32283.1 hypothetical protein DBR32_01345 [Taibaiella sp. KBW10]